MKVLLINGSPHAAGCTHAALAEAARVLRGEGIETELIHGAAQPVRGCVGCGGCAGPHRCVYDDDVVNRCIEALAAADGSSSVRRCITLRPTARCCACWTGCSMPAAAMPPTSPPPPSCPRGRAGHHRLARGAEQVFRPCADAARVLHLLAHGARAARGGCCGGSGGHADRAQPCAQHGVAAALHRGGPPRRRRRAGGRARRAHELHPLNGRGARRAPRRARDSLCAFL